MEVLMPSITSSVLQAERRARSYWDIDGLVVIVQAIAVLLAGLWFLYINHSNELLSRDPRRGSAVVLMVLILLDGVRKSSPIVRWLKAKITYPRTGYVAPLKEPVSRDAHPVGSFGPSWGLLLFFLWIGASLAENAWFCVVAGVATATALWWTPVRQRLASLNVVGICCLGMIIALNLSTYQGRVFHLQRFALALISLGAVGLLKGVFTLVRYIHSNPVVQA
jgi:hypothetical protein